MPSTGTPRSKRPGSTPGASSAYTDAGPPERISASGCRAAISAAGASWGTSSEYTRHSRTRRAMSCEYWPPRSTTSTGRSSSGRSACGSRTTSRTSDPSLPPPEAWRALLEGAPPPRPVVGRFLGDGDVVRVALPHPGGRHADEACLLELLDRRRAAVAHRLTQAPDQLVDDVRQRPFVGDTALDPLGDELAHLVDLFLEVAVARVARPHRPDGAHPAVLLELL